MRTLPTHPTNGKPDRRYSIAREWCGYPTPQWVVRFCGDWIGHAPQQPHAFSIALAHQATRNRSLGLLQPTATRRRNTA